MGFDAGDSNLYRYVNNAPTNATDPSGLKPDPIIQGKLVEPTKAQYDAFLKDNKPATWKLLKLPVYVSESFNPHDKKGIEPIFKDVSTFYLKVGIVIDWNVQVVSDAKYKSVDVGTDWEQFTKDLGNEPVLVLVNSIKGGIRGGTPSTKSISFINGTPKNAKTFAFTIAHELGHGLGLINHENKKNNLMVPGGDDGGDSPNRPKTLADAVVTDEQLRVINNSRFLKPYTLP